MHAIARPLGDGHERQSVADIRAIEQRRRKLEVGLDSSGERPLVCDCQVQFDSRAAGQIGRQARRFVIFSRRHEGVGEDEREIEVARR